MKKYPISTAVSLIMTLDEHQKKHEGEPVTLVFNSPEIDFMSSMGIFDALRAYSQFMDLRIEVRFPIDFMQLAACCGLDKSRVYISKSAFIVFCKPRFSTYGTMTDAKITVKAFQAMLRRNCEVLSVSFNEDTDEIEEWVNEGKIIESDDLKELGYKILGEV